MTRVYLRPLGLSYGAAAVRAMSRGEAGRLGGHFAIAFHAAELIERRDGLVTREIIPYGDLARSDLLARIEAKRSPDYGRVRPAIMGIVNVTPDSFSDGGLHGTAEAAIVHGRTLAAEGAHILDIGGESTRPGSDAVDQNEELRRVIPAITALAEDGHAVSCDTRKAPVMTAAAKAGARIINDVSALRYDGESTHAAAKLGLPVVLMHAQGDPRTMQLNPSYDDVALDVYDFLEERIADAHKAGIEQIIADPGVGFGKTYQHNLDLLSQITLFHGLGVPLLIGLSRKAFIGALTGEKLARDRALGSVGGAVHAALNGAHILRVHDVKATVAALAVALAAADPASSDL